MFLTVAQIIGTSVAVIMLIVLAVKYISASPNDKAQIKQHAVVYIVGAIILFAASGLLGIVKNFAGGITTTGAEDGGGGSGQTFREEYKVNKGDD